MSDPTPTPTITTVDRVVKLPAASNEFAMGLIGLIGAVIANHKAAAGNPSMEVSQDVLAAVKNLGPIMKDVGLLSDEVKVDGLGVAEAFLISGLEVARSQGKA